MKLLKISFESSLASHHSLHNELEQFTVYNMHETCFSKVRFTLLRGPYLAPSLYFRLSHKNLIEQN